LAGLSSNLKSSEGHKMSEVLRRTSGYFVSPPRSVQQTDGQNDTAVTLTLVRILCEQE